MWVVFARNPLFNAEFVKGFEFGTVQWTTDKNGARHVAISDRMAVQTYLNTLENRYGITAFAVIAERGNQ